MEMNEASSLNLSVDLNRVFHLWVCVCLNDTLSEIERKRLEACWQADGLSHCLPRSSTSHPITPASSHQPIVYHSLCSNIHSLCLCLSPSLTLSGTHSHLSLSVCLVGCMSSVRCNPNWQIHCGMCVGVKPVKWCPMLPPFLPLPSLCPGGYLHC